MLTLYDKYDNPKMEIAPSDSSTQQKEVQSDNVLSLSFSSYECVSFEVGDYIDFCGERFWAISRYTPKQISTVEWEYSVQLYGIESLIKQFLVINNTNGEYETEFSLTATAYDHVALIVSCINAGMGTTDWKVGEVVASEYITIDYEGIYCDEGLRTLADKCGVEYWIDGKTVNLSRCEHGASITLGYDNGLTNVYKDTANVKFFTRLFPIGTTRNIVCDDYGYSHLQLPNGVKYLDQDVDKFGVVHHYEKDAFSHVYPRRIGTISSVRSEEVTGDDGNQFKIYYFKDDSLNFDPNDYEIAGLVKTISFQDGSDLAGRDFEVNFNSTTNEFKITTQWPYDNDIQLPNDDLCIAADDEYILWNITMPQEYYPLAEAEYAEAVEQYLADSRLDVSVYKAHTDYVAIAERDLTLTIGQRIRLESEEYFDDGYRESRITKITRKVVRPTEMDIEISDVIARGSLDKINDSVADIRHYTKIATGGLPQMIRSWEATPASDTNIYSARKAVREFLSKTSADTAQKLIKFAEGAQSAIFRTPSWSGGALGAGGALIEDVATGESSIIVHNVIAKNGITAPKFTVRVMTSTGGIEVTSAAYAQLTKVTTLESSWVCYYKSSAQMWQPLDQAKLYNGTGGYLWALVTEVCDQPNEDGEYSITLSQITKAAGSNTSPAIDDTLVLQGNRSTDTADNYRQSFLIRSCGVDNEAEGYYPYEAKYIEIDAFSLPNSKRVYWNGKDYELQVNKFSIVAPDGSVYRQPVYRGDWISDSTPYHNYERVNYLDAIWQCVVDQCSDAPSTTSSSWVRVAYQGADGDSVESVINQYYLHTSKDTVPEIDDSDWSDSPIAAISGKYLWRREKIVYTSGRIEYTDARWDYAEQSAEIASYEQIKNFFAFSDTQNVEDALSALENGEPFTIINGLVAMSNAIISNLVVKQLMTEGGKITLNNDGSGQLASGRISWDIDGNITGDFDAIYTGDKAVYHEGNANLSTIDWQTKDMLVNGMATFMDDVFAGGEIVSIGVSGGISGGSADLSALLSVKTSTAGWADNDYIHDSYINTNIVRTDELNVSLATKLNISAISPWALSITKPSYIWTEVAERPSVVYNEYTTPTSSGADLPETTYGSLISTEGTGGTQQIYQSHTPSGSPRVYVRNGFDGLDRFSNWAMLWHNLNANLPTVDWTAKNLIVNGSVTGVTTITATGVLTQHTSTSMAIKALRSGAEYGAYIGSSSTEDNAVFGLIKDNAESSYMRVRSGEFEFNGNILPKTNLGYNIGSSTQSISRVYTRYIDSISGYHLRLNAAGIEAMYLDSSNGSVIFNHNVGIGTTTPEEKLDVVGNSKVSGDSTVGGDLFVGGNVISILI